MPQASRSHFTPVLVTAALFALAMGHENRAHADFVRGDANNDLLVNIADPVQTLAYLFSGGTLSCLDSADSNDDGAVDIGDPIRTLSYLFSGALPLPAPFPRCGADPTPDGLGCAVPPVGCAPVVPPPQIISLPQTLANVDTLYRYTVAIAPGQSQVAFSLVMGPPGASLAASTGVLEWLPAAADVGIHDFLVQVTTATGIDEQAFGVTVNAWPGAPVVRTIASPTAMPVAIITGTAPGATTVEFVNELLSVTTSTGPGGTFMQAVDLFADQTNYVHVRGINGIGQVSAPTTVLVIQDSQPPELYIDSPIDGGTTYEPNVVVLGRVSDMLSGFSGLIVTVSVNGGPLHAATVNQGIGTNGTFLVGSVALVLGTNTIVATAQDAVGNTATAQVQVERLTLNPGLPTLSRVSGNDQSAPARADLPDPIVVAVMDHTGAPFANKLVTFTVTRSDGRVRAPGSDPITGDLVYQTFTDAAGEAAAVWRTGTDAGAGNQQVEVTSAGIQNPLAFCATALPGAAVQMNIGAGNNQRGETGMPAECVLCAWVSDGNNGVGGVPVTFTVTRGNGLVGGLGGQSEITVISDSTGHAEVAFRYGTEPGNNVVSATTTSNTGLPAVFTLVGVARDLTAPTSFSGLALSNSSQPIGGATCTLLVAGTLPLVTLSTPDGRFEFPSIAGQGPADLFVDGYSATNVGARGVPLGSFPYLHFKPILVPNAANTLPMPALLPQLDPDNWRTYSTSVATILEVEGVEGLRMTVTPGSMTLANGQPAPDGTPIALNIVHHDDVPMPIPDGAAPPFAWTLQPALATFDPPITIEYPNMSGLAPGAISNFLTFNHFTNKFEIFASGSVSPDGATIVSDPGDGLTLAGWGCNCPPYSVTGECEKECDERRGQSNCSIAGPDYVPVTGAVTLRARGQGLASVNYSWAVTGNLVTIEGPTNKRDVLIRAGLMPSAQLDDVLVTCTITPEMTDSCPEPEPCEAEHPLTVFSLRLEPLPSGTVFPDGVEVPLTLVPIPDALPPSVLEMFTDVTLDAVATVASPEGPDGDNLALEFSSFDSATSRISILRALWYSNATNHCNSTCTWEVKAHATAGPESVETESLNVSVIWIESAPGVDLNQAFLNLPHVQAAIVAPGPLFRPVFTVGNLQRVIETVIVGMERVPTSSQYYAMIYAEELEHQAQYAGSFASALWQPIDVLLVAEALANANPLLPATTEADTIAHGLNHAQEAVNLVTACGLNAMLGLPPFSIDADGDGVPEVVYPDLRCESECQAKVNAVPPACYRARFHCTYGGSCTIGCGTCP